MKTQTRRKKFLIIAVALAFIAFIGIGYAYLSKTLNINGSGKVASDFNVQFQEATETTGADLGSVTINEGGDTVTIDVTITKPGEKYVATIPVKNLGKITAKLVSVKAGDSNTVPTDSNVTYSFVPESGVTIGTSELAANEVHNFTFTFDWANASGEQEAVNATYTFTYTINYQQA